MKKLYYSVLLTAMVLFTSCMDKYTETLTVNSPVYMSYNVLRSSVQPTAASPLKKPGKIYFKDNNLFVVEKMEGIHIFDISNPAAPVNIRFIKVPGCIDIAIKNNTLFADSYVDLVAIDISNLSTIKEINRVTDAFPYELPLTNNELRYDDIDQTKGVVTGWEIKKVKKEIKYQNVPVYPVAWYYSGLYAKESFLNDMAISSTAGSSATVYGKSGSMARFGLYDNYLYAADNNAVTIFNIQNLSEPQKIGKQYMGWNIETMFMYDNHMFFGTSNGMIICSLENPIMPVMIASYSHITSCDPVIVEKGYAYVTLRNGVSCRQGTQNINEMDVLKLSSDYKTITQVAVYNFTNPYGLGIDENTLFVCDGSDGLKIYDSSNKLAITSNPIARFPNIQATDVIPINTSKYLFMIGEGGFYLYDYHNLKDIKLLSKIEVEKKL